MTNAENPSALSNATVTEVVLPGVVEPEGLEVRTRPTPAPGPGEVLLEMEATGVSFAEQQMRRGKYYDRSRRTPSCPVTTWWARSWGRGRAWTPG